MSGNQYVPDPRQTLFLQYYLDPKSETFSNALQSALRAGYSEDYAKTILSQELDWLSENLRSEEMLKKAEKNLKRAMEIPIEDEKIGERSLKASIFIAKGLGKEKYSERTELTGANGKDLVPKEDVEAFLANLKK